MRGRAWLPADRLLRLPTFAAVSSNGPTTRKRPITIMNYIYPESLLEPRSPDELFRAEAEAMECSGHKVYLIDTEALASGPARIRSAVEPGACMAYRGWMLTPGEYRALTVSVERAGGVCLTSPDLYLATHYLPNWYGLVRDYTPETAFFSVDADLVMGLAELGWGRFFVKDFVKSLKTSVGSIIERPDDVMTVIAEMEKFRGIIEGGLCVRRVENFVAGSERRYFVLNGVAYAAEPDALLPEALHYCVGRIASPFYSVDVAEREDGVKRVVEIGDGQVSDLVGWTVARFVEMWRNAA